MGPGGSGCRRFPGAERGPAAAIVANNVMAHVPDLNDFVRVGSAVARLAKPLMPQYHLWFEPNAPNRVLRFEGPYGPPGAPELIMEMVDYLYDSSMNQYLKELESLTTPKERMESLLNILFDTSGKLPQRDAVFWSCYAMGFRDEQIREKIKAMMNRFIDFGIEEIVGWEETGLAKVEDKRTAVAKILAMSEGFGILKNSTDDPETVEEVAHFMKAATLGLLSCKSSVT